MRKVPPVVLRAGMKQVKENIVMIVPDCKHQRRPSVVIRLNSKPLFQQVLNNILLSCPCSQVKYIHTLFGLNIILGKLVFNEQI